MNHWSNRASNPARRHFAAIFGAILVACNAGGPTAPEPVQVPVQITSPDNLGLSGPLRIAVVWRVGTAANQHWTSTFDSELTSQTGTVPVQFDLPPRAERSALIGVTKAYVSCNDDDYPIELPAAVPRLVVYEDRDQSGDFYPELPQVSGADRVLAVNPTSNDFMYIAAFTDLDQSLSVLPMEYAECIRDYTSQRYSAFFMADGNSGYLWAEAEPLWASLVLSPTAYASVAMVCSSYDVYSLTNQTSKSIESQTTLADARLETDPCSDTTWPCTRVDTTRFDLPEQTTNVAYPGYSQTFTCTAFGELDVLWSVTDSVECTGCTCKWLEARETWVVQASQAPRDWPCGSTVKYCSALAQSLWTAPSYCTAQQSERPE